MRAAIITTPHRSEHLPKLLELVSSKVDSLKLYVDDDRRGHWWNLERCMREMLDTAPANEPTLIMCDDVVTVPDWRERWEKIHAQAGNDIYTFMSRQRFMLLLIRIWFLGSAKETWSFFRLLSF